MDYGNDRPRDAMRVSGPLHPPESPDDNTDASCIRMFWDDSRDGGRPGWYAELISRDGDIVSHTEMIGEPDLDGMDWDDWRKVKALLRSEWGDLICVNREGDEW